MKKLVSRIAENAKSNTAKWVSKEYALGSRFVCSNCELRPVGFIFINPDDYGYDYCPHCGAKMEENK